MPVRLMLLLSFNVWPPRLDPTLASGASALPLSCVKATAGNRVRLPHLDRDWGSPAATCTGTAGRDTESSVPFLPGGRHIHKVVRHSVC